MRRQGQPCDQVSHYAGNPHDKATQLLVFELSEAMKTSGTFIAWKHGTAEQVKSASSAPVFRIVVKRYAWNASVHY